MIPAHEQFNTFLQTQLNKEQYDAVTAFKGALLVHAGAGSGKTRVITARIAHLMLNHGMPAEAIVALTFTNKAAREMKERIGQFIGHGQPTPFIGTFHSYCLRLLKSYGSLLGWPQFSLLDTDDQLKLIQSIIQKHQLQKQVTAKQAQHTISLIKNKWGTVTANPGIEPLTFAIYQAYEAEKRVSRCFDFDDLLAYTVELFQTKRSFADEHQARVRHVLVDEYQDTNVIQHELLKCLAKQNGAQAVDSVCVVGDEDQSIYSWRGATVENIAHFTIDFPGTRHIKIEQNYRSVQDILSIANDVIENNTQRHPKRLWSTKEAKNRVFHLSCATEYQEGEVVVQLAQAFPRTRKLSDIAVLYRTHSQSRALEEILLRNSIPYVIVGGIQFYERKEIKDLLAYLKLLVNEYDRISFARVLNTPKRKLGPAVEEQCNALWLQEPLIGFKQVAAMLVAQPVTTPQKRAGLQDFLNVFEGISPTDNPYSALQTIIARTQYLSYLKEEYDTEEADSKTENVYEFLRAIDYFVQQGINSVSALLDEIGLMQDLIHKTEQDNTPRLQLMTLHAAKGLEFNTVVLSGLEEGVLPSSRSSYDPSALEEERRLAYVGITRAREYLFMTHARHRYTYGQMTYQDASRFLEEMPKHLLNQEDIAYWKPYQIKDLLTQIYAGSYGKEAQPRAVFTFTQPAKPTTMPTEKPTATPSSTKWRVGQPVIHEVFGTGVVQGIENKSDGKAHLTIRFRSSIKKLDSTFVQKV